MEISVAELIGEFKSLATNVYMHIFVGAILLDIATGYAKALAGKTGNSTKGLAGVVKHVLVACLVMTVYPYMRILGFGVEANLFVGSFIISYAFSFVENWTQLGLPMPHYVRKHFEKLRHLEDSKASDESRNQF
ncbi:phage holin family protein [Enterococcus casseliflavus]|nr:phage holin family protein [Enterococcus casseliflavus]